MEKNIDVFIGRRFKREGVSWTKEGANNLVKLRILHYNKNDWEGFWKGEKLAWGEFLPPLNNTTNPRKGIETWT
jgi:hypothetical protein